MADRKAWHDARTLCTTTRERATIVIMSEDTNTATPLVLAHRGVSVEFPENTVEAFAAALSRGADGVELDVRRTADGALAVHHDPRLADGRAIVELAAADLPDHVPSLQAALAACVGQRVNIELKNIPGEPDFDPESTVADTTVRQVRDLGLVEAVIISSFNFADITRVRSIDADIATGWLVLDMPDPAAMVGHLVDGGHQALHSPAARTTVDHVKIAHDRGIEVNAWTVDDPALITELAEAGVDAVITNDPVTARATLQRWAGSE